MYKVEILKDKVEKAKLERRQRQEAERKQRIFNPKVRIIGLDVDTLDEQVRIKHELKKIEKERETDFDQTLANTTQFLQALDAQVQEARRQQLLELNKYRLQHQILGRGEQVKDHNPYYISNEADPYKEVSSAQRFIGEDLGADLRRAMQKQQMATWTRELLHEKSQREQQELEEKRKYDKLQQAVVDKAAMLQAAIDQAKAEQARLDRDYNFHLAEEKKRREQLAKQRETELNIMEINGLVNGTFLTEGEAGKSDGQKVGVDGFKGMSFEQKAAIRKMQLKQQEEHKIIKDLIQQEEAAYALQAAANNRAAILLEREKARQERAKAEAIRRENEVHAVDHKQRQKHINKILNSNAPNDDYFAQFNTSTR